MPRRTLGSVLLLAAFMSLPPSVDGQPAGFNYDESKVPAYTLPDPLVLDDGTPVTDVATWATKRRPELIEDFARAVYGRTPGGPPAGLHWEVMDVDRSALGGKAVRKQIRVWFSEGNHGPKMDLLVYLPPNATAPVPAFLGLNFYGNHTVSSDPSVPLSTAWIPEGPGRGVVDNRATEQARGYHTSRWQIEQVVARGYATATLYCGDLCEDRTEGLDRDVAALFKTGGTEGRAPEAWGTLGVWAWGLSRALDYLEADPDIDATRVAVHGHSRLGKAALWAGAQDERFALVISNNSGCGGAALSRRRFGETVARINTVFPFWFARNFRAYNEREDTLPVDQHQLIALCAPRPVYVASAEDDKWADPRGEFLSAKGAEPVYALFGKRGLGVEAWPAVDQPVLGDGLAYHVRSGGHDITAYDWACYLDYADKVLRGGKR